MIGYMVLKSFLTIIIGVLFVGLIVLVIVSKGVKNVVNHNALTRVCTGVIIGIFAVIIGFTLIPFGTSEEAVVEGYAQTRTYAQSVKTLSTNVDTFKEEVKKRDEEETAERNGVAKYVYPHTQTVEVGEAPYLSIRADLGWFKEGDGYYGAANKNHNGNDTGRSGDSSEIRSNEIVSACSGTIVTFSNGSNFNAVEIQEDNTGFIWRYLHMKEINTETVNTKGARIEKGDVIGWVGGTDASGNTTYGTHLHLDVKDTQGNHINPFSLGIFDMQGSMVYMYYSSTYCAESRTGLSGYDQYPCKVDTQKDVTSIDRYAPYCLPTYMYWRNFSNCEGFTFSNTGNVPTFEVGNVNGKWSIIQMDENPDNWACMYSNKGEKLTSPLIPSQGGN